MALAILFDLDGTLMDTLDLIVAAMNAAAAEAGGMEPFRAEELRPMIGMPVERQLAELRGIRGPSETFTDRYYAHFSRLVDGGLRLFPGVRETFPRLAGRAIGTMSTRRRGEARHMLRVVGLETYFRAVVGGDDVGRPKPNPDLAVHAARSLGRSPEDCIVVGDSPVDVLSGRAAGSWTIAVSYGYGDPAAVEAAMPHAILDRFPDLPALLEGFDARARG